MGRPFTILPFPRSPCLYGSFNPRGSDGGGPAICSGLATLLAASDPPGVDELALTKPRLGRRGPKPTFVYAASSSRRQGRERWSDSRPARCARPPGLGVVNPRTGGREILDRRVARVLGTPGISPADSIFPSPDGGFATLSDRARSTTDPATARLAVLTPAAQQLSHGT